MSGDLNRANDVFEVIATDVLADCEPIPLIGLAGLEIIVPTGRGNLNATVYSSDEEKGVYLPRLGADGVALVYAINEGNAQEIDRHHIFTARYLKLVDSGPNTTPIKAVVQA